MTNGEIVFEAESLWSKWGFGDGDMLDLDASPYEDREPQGQTWETSHDFLSACVRKFLIAKFNQPIEVYEIGTIHNPIRAVLDDMPSDLEPKEVAVSFADLEAFYQEWLLVQDVNTKGKS